MSSFEEIPNFFPRLVEKLSTIALQLYICICHRQEAQGDNGHVLDHILDTEVTHYWKKEQSSAGDIAGLQANSAFHID